MKNDKNWKKKMKNHEACLLLIKNRKELALSIEIWLILKERNEKRTEQN